MLFSSSSLPPPCSFSERSPSQGQKPVGAQVPALTQAVFNFLFTDPVSESRTPQCPRRGPPVNCAPMSGVDNPNSMKPNGAEVAGTELRCWKLSSLRSHFRKCVPWRGPHPQAPPSFTALRKGRRQHQCHCVPKHGALLQAHKSHQHGSALQGLSKHFCKA